jgi:hypothetical protein
MRSAVKRPTKNSQANPITSSKIREEAIDPMRFSRSHGVAKSMKVSRFGHPAAGVSARKTEQPRIATGEVLSAAQHAPAKAQSLAQANPLPSMVTSASHQQLERLLDLALVQADSHKQRLDHGANKSFPRRLKFASNWKGLAAGLTAVLLLVGFFAWQRVPQVAMKVTAMRAHVNASLPAYVPQGYSFAGPVKHSGRSVTVRFVSAKDSSQSFELTQKISNMNSTSFAATTLPKGTQIQTSQVNGNIIYIYGQTNHAAWVNHGMAYTIKDNAHLDSDQLLRIAGSL